MIPQRPSPGGSTAKIRSRAPKALRSGLLMAARIQDHLRRMDARFHFWITIHTLVAISCLMVLALYFLGGRCCT